MRRFLCVLLLLVLCSRLPGAQNQTASKQLTIQVVASGGSHHVNLSWTPGDVSPCGAVVGYKVYRGAQPALIGYLTSTATTIYVDSAVISGQTYSYYVTAYADSTSTCNPLESTPSQVVIVTIP